jgi:hypothetical protein
MFNFIYESKVEYVNIRWYVVLAYWSKNFFFDEIVDLLLSKCDELRKSDVHDRIEFSDDSEANIEIEAKTKAKAKSRSSVVLNTKLKYAVNARYFRRRSRSRLNEFEKISDSDFWSFEAANSSFDWDIFDDFETDAMNEESVIEIKSDEFSRWLSS